MNGKCEECGGNLASTSGGCVNLWCPSKRKGDAVAEIASLRGQVESLTAKVADEPKCQKENFVATGCVVYGPTQWCGYSGGKGCPCIPRMRAQLARLRASHDDPARVERAAEAIFITKYKLEGADEPDRAWKSEAPWDTDAESTLCEWERDEYRQAARAALAAADEEPKPC